MKRNNTNRDISINYRNLFYMLCYATKYLNKLEFADADIEDVQGTHDMLAYLLCKSFELLIKNGYIKEYDIIEVITDHPDGEIDIQKSMELGVYAEGKLVCRQNKLVIDNIYNQYIKAAINLLLTLSNDLKTPINSRLIYKLRIYKDVLDKVSHLEDAHNFNIDIDSAKLHYKPVLEVAQIIFEEYIIWDRNDKDTNPDKRRSLFKINDSGALCYIFEEFGRNFYQKEYKKAHGEKKSYNIDNEGFSKANYKDEVDLYLKNDKDICVIDFKWYKEYNNKFTKRNIAADVRHQIESYIDRIDYSENYDEQYKMLNGVAILAVDNDYPDIPSASFKANRRTNTVIRYRGLNINKDFKSIKQQLIDIADEVFK